MQRIVVTAALALALVSGAVFALAGKPGAPGPQGQERTTLEDLAWLAGSWSGTMFELTAEEVWSTPAVGGMMGMFRLLGEKQASVYEFILLEQDAQGLHLRFQHIGTGYEVWEEDGPLAFDLVSGNGRVFTFESPDATQSPNRIIYGQTDEDQLIVTVETRREGQVKESFDVVYNRAE